MNHLQESLMGFPSGIEVIQGKKTFSNISSAAIYSMSPNREALRIGLNPSIFCSISSTSAGHLQFNQNLYPLTVGSGQVGNDTQQWGAMWSNAYWAPGNLSFGILATTGSISTWIGGTVRLKLCQTGGAMQISNNAISNDAYQVFMNRVGASIFANGVNYGGTTVTFTTATANTASSVLNIFKVGDTLTIGGGETQTITAIVSDTVVTTTAWSASGTNAGISTTSGTSFVLRLNGQMGVGWQTLPSAWLHLGAGTSGTSTAPLKFTSGTNLTTAETGAMEYNGTNLFFTRTGTTRESIFTGNDAATAPATTAGTPTTRYGGNTKYLGDPVSWASVVVNGTTYKIPLYT